MLSIKHLIGAIIVQNLNALESCSFMNDTMLDERLFDVNGYGYGYVAWKGFACNPGQDSLLRSSDSACGVCTALVRAGTLTQCFFIRLLSAKPCGSPGTCCPVAIADAQEMEV